MKIRRVEQVQRLFTIFRVFLRHRLDDIFFTHHPAVAYLFPGRKLQNSVPWAVRFCHALEDLGPIFVKIGQILSTRGDLLPDEVALALTRLQDRVSPFPGEIARAKVEAALGGPVERFFREFNETPLASASVAQVHAARLHTGRSVVVKILRPNIWPILQRDLALLYTLADLVERYRPEARRLHLREVVAELEKSLSDELDLVREAANGATLKRNFEGSKIFHIPEVEWDYTRSDILVLERVHGIPIGNLEALKKQGINLRILAERGVEIFFTQVFRHNYFHADMHPGNIFVTPDAGYIAVDFGIMGSLSTDDQKYLAENFLAFFRRDYRRVAELHIASGWVGSNTRVDEFEGAIRCVCEPIFQKPFGEISFGQLLLRLFQVARRFHMEIQPQLVLLQKTLINVEGIGRKLYPQLDLWSTAQPFLEKWLADRLGPKAFFSTLLKHVPRWGEQLPEIPLLALEVLQNVRAAQRREQTSAEELAMLRREIQQSRERTQLVTAAVAFFFAAAWLHGGAIPRETLSWASPWLGGIGLSLLLVAWKR
ncbi:putative protein kinase UbiB [Gammaproteobacteria bacterium]